MAQAVLTVDLGAVVRNWRRLCAAHPTGSVAGVVKADAYGLGAVPVARALRDAGCRHFFVAHPEEGAAVREALGEGPMVAILNGCTPEEARSGLTPVLNSLGDIVAHRGSGVRALLHADTGMARLGLPPTELERLASDPASLEGIQVDFVMTHLACAEEPDHPMNARQAERFAEACTKLPRARRSVANSSGIFLGPRFASDLARPGVALYGANPTPYQDNPMEPVLRLSAPILQIREIPAGETVGYSATWMAARPSRIATVACGYADGWPRSLSSAGKGWLAGREVPLAGRVSMDLLTFDVTDAPEAAPGQMIELLGPHRSVDDVAAEAGTIAYEVLTRLGRRYRREYVGA